jgi:hypothetical protein
MTITIEPGITIDPGIIIGQSPVIKPKTVTVIVGGRVSTTQVKFGTGSLSSGTLNGGLLVTPPTGFGFGTGNFTLEYWYYPTSYAESISMDFRPLGTSGFYPTIFLRATGITTYYTNSTILIQSTTTATPLNQWSSVAVVRSSNITKLYINGTQQGVSYSDPFNYLQGSCTIGCNGFTTAGINPVKGYMDEIRVSNVARYTSNYTPATQPFVADANTLLLINCDGVDGSTQFADTGKFI